MRPEKPVRGRGDEGTAVVEFALVLPLLLVVLLAVVQIGLFVRDRLLVESAARSAARTAAVVDDAVAIHAAAESASGLPAPALTVEVSRAGERGAPVRVSVRYVAHAVLPMVAWLLPGGVEMRSEVTARQEFG